MPGRKLVSFDWAIKKILRDKANFAVLEGFLSELLREDIQVLELLDSESNQDDLGHKYNRVDLKVRNSKGEIVIIEVQYETEFDFLQRIVHGTSKTVVEHMEKGAPYSKLPKVISVSILYFDLGKGKDYIYRGGTSFRGLHHDDVLELSPQQKQLYGREKVSEVCPEYYLIKVKQFDDAVRDGLDEWIYFLKHEEIKDKFEAKGLKEAKERLDVLKLSKEERAAYERYCENLHYQASMVESSYGMGKLEGKLEGLEIGLEKGKEIGLEKGKEIGLEKGKEIGRKEERKALARKLLDLMDVDTIARTTGLTTEEVAALERGGQ